MGVAYAFNISAPGLELNPVHGQAITIDAREYHRIYVYVIFEGVAAEIKGYVAVRLHRDFPPPVDMGRDGQG